MIKVVAVALRATMVGMLTALLVGQVLVVPGLGAPMAAAGIDPLVGVALLVVAEVVLACVQVAVVCTWVLLGMVERERIFAGAEALRWVDGIVVASVVATVVVGGALWLTVGIGRPGISTLSSALLATALFGVGFSLLLVVMRGLLRQASQLRAELAEVV